MPPASPVGRCHGQWVEFHGAYDDEYVLSESRWKFASRVFRTRAHRSSSGGSG
jgi:hypothetical protein